MKTILEGNRRLEEIANKKGFKVLGSPFNDTHVNLSRKTITLNANINNKRNFKFSHELGHIYTFRIWKWLIFLDELIAWIIGFFICKKNRINTKGFWTTAKQCLKTYVKRSDK